MKEINLSNLEIDSIKLTHFDAYLDDKYRKPHTEGGYGFYDKSGIEHYSMLAYLSTYYNNKTILDIGTYKGGSALALSFNQNNKIISVDVKHQVTKKIDLPNITFLEGNILDSNNRLIEKSGGSNSIPTSGLFDLEEKELSTYIGPELIKSASLILYDTVHNGIVEKEFHNYLINTNWEGICIWDDIKFRHNKTPRKGMQDFWDSIDSSRKLDITKYAHWTGTGLVWYGNKIPSINLS